MRSFFLWISNVMSILYYNFISRCHEHITVAFATHYDAIENLETKNTFSDNIYYSSISTGRVEL